MEFPALDMSVAPRVDGFFDPASNTISYIVADPTSAACAIIDSVLDMDYAAGRITHDSADHLIAAITSRGLSLEWIIETHVHADHLSAAPYVQQKLGGRIGVGARIVEVQDTSAGFSTKAPSLSATACNSTPCLRTETPTPSAA